LSPSGVIRRGSAATALPLLGDILVVSATVLLSVAAVGMLVPGVAAFVAALLLAQIWDHMSERGLRPSAVDDLSSIAKRSLLCFGGVAAFSVLIGHADLQPVLATAVVAAPGLVAGRAISYSLARNMRKETHARTLIVGGGRVAQSLVAALAERAEYGMDVVGAVDDEPKLNNEALGTRVLGPIRDLAEIARSHNVENVIVAFTASREADTMHAVRAASEMGLQVWVVPRLYELGSTGAASEHLWGYPLQRVTPPAATRPEWMLKRALDIVVSVIALILAAPVTAIISAAILIDSGRPIFFKQPRLASGFRPFLMLKFRSMAPAARALDDPEREWIAEDHRVTKVGRVLRATGLDEMPQLLNVLKGEMSLVGPRPEEPVFVERFNEDCPGYVERHRLPMGVTGWSQIHGLRGGDTSIEDRTSLDNYYIDNWSLWQDLKIILKTIPTLVKKQEADR
jgi:exopolysaccharide biosynthesis polyprenyl glycosylphosphotransferase